MVNLQSALFLPSSGGGAGLRRGPLRWLALIFFLIVLSACVTQPQRIAGTSTARNAAELNNWTASGRLGVTGIEQSGSGGFTWTQQMDVSDVLVRGPAGIGALAIHVQGLQLSLRASDGTQYDADQALWELENRLGAPVPVMQLRYWVRGIAAPGEHHWSAPDTVLEQNGWRIQYSDWLQRDGLRLPGRIVLNREQLRIVIVVQEWRLA